ncbi:MAG: hypothetical protein CK426_09070 [Legionella sp.]|nr:MAG: hypothetical protein CK423_10150 [Legionella sp.]PJD96357.1 MAG: hypothetical protein CK426_09070 [Legionella sp.]
MKSLETVSLNNQLLIVQYMKEQRPFIIKTGLDFTLRTFDYLEQISSELVTVLKKINTCGTRKHCLKKTMTLFQYLHGNEINNGWFLSANIMKNKAFMNQTRTLITQHSPALGHLLEHRKAAMTNLWISSGNKIEGLHNDPAVDNFNIQLMGKKTFYLAPPGNKGFYPGSLLKHLHHTSAIHDLFHYDKNRYPEFFDRLPEFYKGDLSSGDLIFIPSFWWHQVHTKPQDLSVNINWWYVNIKTMPKHLKQTIGMWYVMLYRYLYQRHLA